MTLRSKQSWFGVVLDALSARELARLHARLLSWTTFNESDGCADLAPSESAGYNLAFTTEPNWCRSNHRATCA
jgi:hypothetical protein